MKKIYKNLLKADMAILIALAFIIPGSAMSTKFIDTTMADTQIKTTHSDSTGEIIFQDGFESYTDFVVDDFSPWTTYDGDGGETYGVEGYDWENACYTGSFMIFNPSQTTDPLDEFYPAHTGEKYATCWDAITGSNPNDDWLFSPKLIADQFYEVSFWAQSMSEPIPEGYGLENFTVSISTTDTDPASFTKISPGDYVQPPANWTEYSYNISSYSGQQIYIGIHIISNDVFCFFLDDFSVTGTGGVQPLTVDAGGPYTASTGVNISFTGSATGGVGPYSYVWNFGNGDTSHLQNPTYAYDTVGDYTVTLTVIDSADPVNTVNDTTTATISSSLEILGIKGGFGLTITVKNNGATDLTDVAWSLSFDGGLIIPKEKSGTIDIKAGETKTIKAIVFGFGQSTITVKVGSAQKIANGMLLIVLWLGVE